MNLRLSTFVVVALLAGVLGGTAQASPTRRASVACPSNLSWMLEYAAPNNKSDDDNEKLVRLPCFKRAIQNALGSAPSFLGRRTSVAETALASVEVYGSGPTSENGRYITITGCVPHDCPSRGLIWIDTQGQGQIIFAVSRSIATKPSVYSEVFHLWLYSSLPIPDDLTFSKTLMSTLQSVLGSEEFLSVTLIQPHGEMLVASPSTLNLHPISAPAPK